MRPPTSHDVAALAGVSQPTVSRALRDDPRVTLETRRRVREAAEALSYIPSRRGRSLVMRATGQVAIVVSDLGNPFFSEAIFHLHTALEDADLRAVVYTDRPDNPVSPTRLLDGLVDAAILTSTVLDSPLPRELSARGLPVVQLNRVAYGEAADACVSDQEMGAREVAEFLADLGHTRIGAIFGPPETSTGRAREAGFRMGLEKRRIELPDERVRFGPFTTSTGEQYLKELMSAERPPTAIFCANDVIAVGVLNAARALDIPVPQRLTVIGFDDIGLASWEVFRLTTVHQDLPGMCRSAVKLVRERIADPQLPLRRIGLGVELVKRESHGPPPEDAD